MGMLAGGTRRSAGAMRGFLGGQGVAPDRDAEARQSVAGLPVPSTLVPVLFGAFGAFLVLGGRDLEFTAATGGPGPGLFPRLTGAVIVALAVVMCVRESLALRKSPGAVPAAEGRIHNVGRLLQVLVTIVVGTAGWAIVGAVPSIVLTVFWLLKVIEGRSWWMSLGAAAALAASSFLIFEVALDIPLPGRMSAVIGL